MNPLMRLIHRLLPRDRYHDLAEQVNNRGLFTELVERAPDNEARLNLLNKRLQVIERRHGPR